MVSVSCRPSAWSYAIYSYTKMNTYTNMSYTLLFLCFHKGEKMYVSSPEVVKTLEAFCLLVH